MACCFDCILQSGGGSGLSAQIGALQQSWRGSLLTLTIVNLSWHAMEVSIQDPPWPYGEASQPRLWEAKPSSLAACGSRASHCNERQMLGGSSSKDPEA